MPRCRPVESSRATASATTASTSALATAAGLLCTNTPDVLHQSVAELTMLLILAAARHFEQVSTAMRGAMWTPQPGGELHGKTLAIIGCGTIGRATAHIAKAGFGMRVVGYRRSAPAPEGDLEFDAITTDFGEAVGRADYVSLHIPASPENAGFMNEHAHSAPAETRMAHQYGAWSRCR